MKNKKSNLNKLKKLAGEWLSRANDDELSARDILNDREGAPSTVCFLSQQIAEKYLKGYLVYANQKFPKIHALDVLVKLCQKIDKSFGSLKKEAEYLTEFYITTRYPGDFPIFSFKEAEKAFKAAIKIKNFVIKKIK